MVWDVRLGLDWVKGWSFTVHIDGGLYGLTRVGYYATCVGVASLGPGIFRQV